MAQYLGRALVSKPCFAWASCRDFCTLMPLDIMMQRNELSPYSQHVATAPDFGDNNSASGLKLHLCDLPPESSDCFLGEVLLCIIVVQRCKALMVALVGLNPRSRWEKKVSFNCRFNASLAFATTTMAGGCIGDTICSWELLLSVVEDAPWPGGAVLSPSGDFVSAGPAGLGKAIGAGLREQGLPAASADSSLPDHTVRDPTIPTCFMGDAGSATATLLAELS